MPIALPAPAGRSFDAVGFGLNMTDLLVVVERFPRPGSKQPIRRQAYSPGGQAASAMVACARLGWRARYVGCFGDDDHGRQGRSSLTDDGVDVRACRVASDTRNGLSVILVDERTGERTVLWSRDPGLRLLPDDVDSAAVCAGRALLVDCHDTAAAAVAARHARRAGVRTVVDVERVRDGIDALLAEIDVIITAQDFPAALTGESRPGAALRAIRDAYQPALVCMTLGAEGSLALVGDVEVRTPAFRVPVVDTTGAGDVFRGGFLAGWLRAGDAAGVEDVLRYANAVAALKCRGLGAREASPTPAEVDALLAGGSPRPRAIVVPDGATPVTRLVPARRSRSDRSRIAKKTPGGRESLDPEGLDEKDGNRGRIRCPVCGWCPDGGRHWVCKPGCGTCWNTFETRARCPGCSYQWEWTACPSCGIRSLHLHWYTEDE